MATTETPVIDEVAERLIVEYLNQRVRAGLAGSDGEDLVDQTPTRSIFAGVLQAPRQRDEEAASKGTVSGDAPMGTALGLSFRVRPRSGQTSVTLTINSRWAHYYPVFPTWEQTVAANPTEDGSSDTSIGHGTPTAVDDSEVANVDNTE